MTAGLLAAGLSPTAPVRRYPYRAPARRTGAGGPAPEPVWLPDAARRTLACFSASGGGKSLLLGRFLAWQDFRRGLPVVVFDPKGQTIDYFLDKIACLDDLDEKAALWRRVRYVNLNGQDGRITPFPVLAAMRPTEPFAAIAQRFIDVLINSDPYLKTASMQGENALAEVGPAVGIVLAALGLGISEAWSLLCETGDWDTRLAQVAAAYPETAEAVAHVRALRGLSPRDQRSEVLSLRAKLALFRFAANFKASFGAVRPGLNWQQVVDTGQAVLLDFGGVRGRAKRWCYLWAYESFLTFVRQQRGYRREQQAISVIIDEVSDLLQGAGIDPDVLTAQFNELINVLARSHKLWVTIAGQELHQLPENLLQTVLTATAVLFGKTSDPEMAARLARRFYRYDPFKVKQSEPVQGVVVNPTAGGFMQPGGPAVYGTTHYRDTAYTQEEQTYFNSLDFQELAPKHFLFGRAEQEGDLPTGLEHITIASLDARQYVDEERAARLRRKLTARDGYLAAEILAEIEQRRRACPCLARPAFHHIVHGHDQHPPSPPAPPAAAAAPRRRAGTPTARPAREQSPAAARPASRTPRPPAQPPQHTVAPPAGAIGRGPGR